MKRPQTGFTLLEVLVALAITGSILVMLSQGFRIGLRGTESYARAVQMQSEMEPIARALRHMIESMDPGVDPDVPVVRGTDRALAFTTSLPNPATGGAMTADVRLETDHGRLILSWAPHAGGTPLYGPPAPQQKILMTGVDGLRISYVAVEAPGTWLSYWSQKSLPALIRLVLTPETAKAWPPIIVRPLRSRLE